jgi:hypothetical protein
VLTDPSEKGKTRGLSGVFGGHSKEMLVIRLLKTLTDPRLMLMAIATAVVLGEVVGSDAPEGSEDRAGVVAQP